jgi:hypothetical protein
MVIHHINPMLEMEEISEMMVFNLTLRLLITREDFRIFVYCESFKYDMYSNITSMQSPQRSIAQPQTKGLTAGPRHSSGG